jgi:hypothetical protein
MASGSSFASFRPNPNVPIPNSPFYFAETSFLEGDVGRLIIGSGLTINYATGVLSASGGGGGGAVNQVTGGAGISVSPTTGNVVVANTGVLQVTAGTGITVSGSKTNYTISSSFNGTVTSVTAGVGLTGGNITSSGTIAIDGNVVLLKSLYTGKGQLLVSTAAGNVTPLSSGGFPNGYTLVLDSTAPTGMKWDAVPSAVQSVAGTAPIQVTAGSNPVVSVATATTGQEGTTTLVNDVATNDPTKALTAAQGYALQQQINGLAGAGGLTLAGTLNASTGLMATVTANGSGAGFTAGSVMPAPAPGNADYFVIVTTPGNYDPPGPGGPYAASQGDWFNSTGTAWDYLNVGFDAPYATTSTAGLVCMATNAEAILGTDSTKALTPLAGKCAYVPLACLTAKGSLITATSALTPTALSVGSDGQVLTACNACIGGLTWASASIPAIPCACITAKGDLISGTSANNPVALNVGSNGQILTVDTSAATGLAWQTLSLPFIPCACVVGKGALVTGTGASAPTALPVGSDGQILTANSLSANGLCWITAPYIPCSIVTAKGGVITSTAANTPAYLASPAGDNCMLISCGACTTGLTWICRPQPATPLATGLVFGCTAGNNVVLGCGTSIFPLINGSTCLTLIGSGAAYNGAINTAGDTFVGFGVISSLGCYCTGGLNVGVGACALGQMRNNSFMNTALGACIHSASPMQGCNNVIIGAGINVPNPTGSRQLAIGFSPYNFPATTNYWLTGCSDKTIQPGAGILDQLGQAGIAATSSTFQVLTSNGVAGVVWCDLPVMTQARPGVVSGVDSFSAITLGSATAVVAFNAAATSDAAAVFGNQTATFVTDVSCSTLLGSCIGSNAVGSPSITFNTFVGSCAAFNLNSTCNNTAVGFCSAASITGNFNTFLGACAGTGATLTGSNNTAIGFGAIPVAGASNSVTLGNAGITTIRAAVTSITAISDARDKDNIRALPLGIDFIRDVKPVAFTWKQRVPNPVKDGTEEAGFIAQQLQEAVSKHNAEFVGLVNQEDPDHLEVSPGKLLPILVKALHDLADSHEKLRSEFNTYRELHS